MKRFEHRLAAGGALALLLPLLGCATAAGTAAASGHRASSHREEVETWRQERLASLKADDGWLSLVNLAWLDEGENRFGSDPENEVVLPEGKSPKVAGTLIRQGQTVRVRVEPGAQGDQVLSSDGKPVTGEMALQTDAQGKPTVLEMGPVSFYIIERGDRLGVRVKDKTSPVLTSFRGLDQFPIRESWRIVARFEPYQPARAIPIPNVLGQVQDQPSPGAAVFEWQGKTYRLDALGSVEEGLSFIFGDETNGKETYGAGRFLDTGPPKDGKVVIDFNTAYNPPCAFTAYATCPLPPAQNKLALRVEAGEKKFAGGPEH